MDEFRGSGHRKCEIFWTLPCLKKGVPVRLKLVSDDVLHSIVISGLHINETMQAGGTSEIMVTPTDTGDFKGVCGKFCGTGHGKMVLTVHVVNGG
jgi:cytochrome c oxidase subunit II